MTAMSDRPKRRIALVKIVGKHAKDFASAVFKDALEALLPQVREGDWHSNPLVVPFTLTCAAALEATLNDHLVAFAFSEFGADGYRRLAEAYVSMPFRAKLDVFVPTLSKGRLVVRADSHDYQILADLIKRRNELVHSKSFFVDACSWIDEGSRISIDAGFSEKLKVCGLRSLTSDDCRQFHASIQALDVLFLYPLERGDLVPNSLVQQV